MQWGEASTYALTDGKYGHDLLAYGSLRDSGRNIREVYIDELVVAPRYRDNGLGKIMLQGLEGEANRGKFVYISLVDKPLATDFFLRHGFVQHPKARNELRKSL